jgi:hypothetical protein
MAGGTLHGDGSVPTLSENSCKCEELMCQCCLKLKGELQEVFINLFLYLPQNDFVKILDVCQDT